MTKKLAIYADNAATTQLHPEVLEKMLPYYTTDFGNPSSHHLFGRKTQQALKKARGSLRTLLGGAEQSQIIFTSGGTEANNLALKGFFSQTEKKHLITSEIEHSSVLHVAKHLESQGISVTYLPVNQYGLVSLEALEKFCTPDTGLVSVMFANNEVGTIQNMKEIATICRSNHVPFHCDAVQAVGHLPLHVADLGISMLSLSAHKFHGPKGVGALYVAPTLCLDTQIHGGGQEHHLRSGTENVPHIIGMVTALEIALATREHHEQHLKMLKNILLTQITTLPETISTGHPHQSLSGILNFAFADISGEGLQAFLDLKGIYCSTGSACSSGSQVPSHVLTAMGISEDMIHGSLRISLCGENTEEEVKEIAKQVINGVEKLRNTKKNISTKETLGSL